MEENSLYERGILSIQRKEELRELALEDKERIELQELQETPLINSRSKQLIGNRDLTNLPNRFMDWEENRNSKLSQTRSQLIEFEKEHFQRPEVFTPAGYSDPLTAWEERVMRYEEIRSQNPDIYSHRPEINSHSRTLMAFQKEKVEDRLNRINQIKLNKLEDIRLNLVEELPSFTPTVNSYKKPRPTDVNSHLYETGLQEKERKAKIAEACHRSAHSFKPKISSRSKYLAKYKKTEPRLKEVEEKTNERELKPSEFNSFIERNYENYLNERLNSRKEPEVEPVEVENKSPKPEVVFSLYERTMQERKEKERKLKNAREKKEINEMSECSFKPKLIERSYTPTPSSIDISYRSNEGYCKEPKDGRPEILYTDKMNKTHWLRANNFIDPSLLESLEDLEKKVYNN